MDSPPSGAVDVFVHITGASEPAAKGILQAHSGDLQAAINSFFSDREELLEVSLKCDDGRHATKQELDGSGWMEEEESTPFQVPESAPFLQPVWGRPTAASCVGEITLLKRTGQLNDEAAQHQVSRTETEDSSDLHEKMKSVPVDWCDHETYPPVVKTPSTLVAEETLDGRQRSIIPKSLGSLFHSTIRPVAPGNEGRSADSVTPVSSTMSGVMGEERQDIEEEMMRAVIEGSKKDNGSESWKSTTDYGQGFTGTEAIQPGLPALLGSEDDDLSRAVTLSLQTAEQEKVTRERSNCSISPQLEEMEGDGNAIATNSSKVVLSERATLLPGGSHEENDEMQEEPLVRRRMSRIANRSTGQSAAVEVWQDAPMRPEPEEPGFIAIATAGEEMLGDQRSGGLFQAEEWGGISFEEHDEAVMLEAAYGLGGASYLSSTTRSLQVDVSERRVWQTYQQVPSPTVVAQRRLREQQDDEYHASLAADKEKEIKAFNDAQSRRRLAEEAAKAEEKLQREKEVLQLQAAQELEMQLRVKKESLPPEPGADEDAVITILVRMPDGRRQGRRFRRFDTLQSLFDFIDVYGGIGPGTYRLVRQYPRRTFTDGEEGCTLHGAGLNDKQEALFLEMM